MKLTTLIITTCLLQLSAATRAQISLNEKKASLETILNNIQKQTGVQFLYNVYTLKKAKPISIRVNNAPLDAVLKACFADQSLYYEVKENTVIVKEKEPSFLDKTFSVIQSAAKNLWQDAVRGVVKDQDGNPLPNASIRVKGKNAVTNTNAKGEFEIKDVEDDAVLLVSYVGYKSLEIPLKNAVIPLEIKLNPLTGELEEVNIASTGYQKIKPNEVTGSMVLIDNKTLNEQTGTNILKRLDGVISGLSFNVGKSGSSTGPTPTTGITIRGLNTINGPLDPLIVLDNFIFEGDVNNINPNDIENVTILKDAAATSIWGARAGNGVIVITTKKATFDQKLRLDVSSNLIISDKPNLYYLPKISSKDYIDVEEFIFKKGYFESQIGNSQRPALTPAVEVFLQRRNGTISASDSAMQINALKAIDSREQYSNYFYQKSIIQQHNLNLRGGSSNLAWIIAGNFDKTIGTLKNTFEKLNLRFLNTYKPFKNFKVDLGVYYTSSKAATGVSTADIRINNRQVPYLRIADDEGFPLPIYNYRKEYIDTVGDERLLDWRYYPLNDYKHDYGVTNLQEIISSVNFSYEFLNVFSFNLSYQNQRQWSAFERQADLESFYARDLINKFSQINYSSGMVNYKIPKGSILNYSILNQQSQNLRGQLNYNESWQKNEINAIIGMEVRESANNGNSSNFYGYVKDPLSYGAVDFINRYPTILPGFPQSIPGAPNLFPTIVHRFASIYSNISYIFDQRYVVSASIRKDAANIFGLTTNDKWNPLWSAGAGWNLSNESFYKLDWLPFVKIRATLGVSGNVDLRKSPLPVAAYLTNPVTNFPIARIGALNNPSLRWEKNKQFNIGIDFGIRNQRISGTIDYYIKKGYDLYGETPYDYTTWGQNSTIVKNVANTKGQGFDISISSKNIDRTIKWNTKLYLNYNKSITTEYFSPNSQNIQVLVSSSGNSITPIVGKPLYALAAYKWGGLNNVGDPQGYLNGQLTTDYNSINVQITDKEDASESIVYIGSSTPPIFGSFINELDWKGLSISLNFTYKFGYYFRKQSFTSSGLINNGYGHGDYVKRWKFSGDELLTNIPALVYTSYPQFNSRDNFYSYSEANILKGDNIRLQYINLSYTFRRKGRSLPFERINLYANLANIGVFWSANKENIDPEYPSSIPPPLAYTAGIKIAF